MPVLALLLVMAVTGCSSSHSAAAQGSSTPSPSATASATPTGSTSTAPPPCPNPEGGSCLGALHPGQTYTTSMFRPTISYSVPEAAWKNYEDLAGNFLIVPPENDLDGVNAGTSDFIGVYTSIAAARFIHLPNCASPPVSGVARTPQAFAAWVRHQRDVSATAPVPVSIGGLHGLRIDLKLKPGVRVPHCIDDLSGNPVRVLPILTGVPPSSLDHGLIPHLTMRLYLLTYRKSILGIELDDVAKAPGSLVSLSAVAEKLLFGR